MKKSVQSLRRNKYKIKNEELRSADRTDFLILHFSFFILYFSRSSFLSRGWRRRRRIVAIEYITEHFPFA
ncbi:hypothetical protein, partial [Rhizobium leguminosarum]|uniref:hypothetical protein n=1 Tax=Rhizobium leguminosarum TaxID=384 RepID=UPI003F9AC572